MTPASGAREREPWEEAPDAKGSEDEELMEYMGKFRPARSGKGKILRERLGFPYNQWRVARWVGRRTNGQITATVFEPTRPKPGRHSRDEFLKAGPSPLMQQEADSEEAAFAWLLAAEKSGEIQKRASKQIEAGGYQISWDPPTDSRQPKRRVSHDSSDPIGSHWDRFDADPVGADDFEAHFGGDGDFGGGFDF